MSVGCNRRCLRTEVAGTNRCRCIYVEKLTPKYMYIQFLIIKLQTVFSVLDDVTELYVT